MVGWVALLGRIPDDPGAVHHVSARQVHMVSVCIMVGWVAPLVPVINRITEAVYGL